MDLDPDKIDEAALGLMYLTEHDRCRVWKAIDWTVTQRLNDKGLIENPANAAKSVVLTPAGLEAAEAARLTWFGRS